MRSAGVQQREWLCPCHRKESKEPAGRPSVVRVNPFVPQGEPALPFAKALRVNSVGIHEKANRTFDEALNGSKFRSVLNR